MVDDEKMITEEELKQAFKKAILEYNKELMDTTTPANKILFNKLILRFVADVLENLNLKYN